MLALRTLAGNLAAEQENDMDLPQDHECEKTPQRGRWKKGQSGNPGGRPLGARNRAALDREHMLEGYGNQLIEKTIELALQGDPKALKLCLDRLMPVPRQRTIHLPLQHIEGAQTLAAAMREVLKAVAQGEVTPEEAESVARIILAHRQVIETVDHEKRLAALEANAGGKSTGVPEEGGLKAEPDQTE